MKKLFALILVCALMLSLVGCNKEEDESFSPEMVDTSGMDFSFTDRDVSGSYDTSVTAVSEANATITSGGTYIFTGGFTGITVDADGEKVQLVLSGAEVSSSNGPAIYIKAAKKVFITLAEGTENLLTDGAEYSEELIGISCDGCIFSKADLTINGSGKLTVLGNYKHGIVSKDDLIIAGATLAVTSQSAGIEGKDCLKARDSYITVESGTDGIKSTNTDDNDRGFIFLENCKLNITSGGDSVQASRFIKILSGAINIKSGTNASTSSESYKGIKSDLDIAISGGKFTIDSKDDAIHANNSISISGGDLTMASG
ncbi:MAG: carbohydrate-binding domain-containing protein, partial [Clostridia bacterium]|nr:carbohydrate-binding domain-containing protein [Clostridia bacterium]